MPILNPFETNNAFNLISLSEALNIIPNTYGRIRNSGLFRDKPVRSRTIMIEKKNNTLNLLKTLPPGSPGQKNKMGLRNARPFIIPHIPVDDVILPEEYDGLRAFGSESQLETLANLMNEHLENIRAKFAITEEYQKMGALKGIVYDSDGTVLVNYFQEFTVKQEVVDFLLGTASTDILAKCVAVKRIMEDNLQGETMTSIRVEVDSSFWDKFISHTLVKAAYDRWREGAALREDLRDGFEFGGLTFREYRGTATDFDGTARPFLDTDEGIAYPLGTQNVFKDFICPADFLETINTLGKRLYAKQEARKFNRGIDIHTQSNTLPMCMRPSLIVKVHTSN
jgi:hypothetical protein